MSHRFNMRSTQNMEALITKEKSTAKYVAIAKGRVVSRCAKLAQVLKNVQDIQGVEKKDLMLDPTIIPEYNETRYKVLPKKIKKPMSMADFNELPQQMKRGIAPGTGCMVEVPVGTPLCCDPTSETYWSM